MVVESTGSHRTTAARWSDGTAWTSYWGSVQLGVSVQNEKVLLGDAEIIVTKLRAEEP